MTKSIAASQALKNCLNTIPTLTPADFWPQSLRTYCSDANDGSAMCKKGQ